MWKFSISGKKITDIVHFINLITFLYVREMINHPVIYLHELFEISKFIYDLHHSDLNSKHFY